MRKTFFALAAALLLAACTGKAPGNGALIEADAIGYEQNDKYLAILFEFNGTAGMEVGNDTLRDGHFSFRLDSLGGDHYNIAFADIADGRCDILNSGPEIYLEPGAVVRIQGEGAHFADARITSPSRGQKLRERFLRMISLEDRTLRQDAEARYKELRKEIRAGGSLTAAQRDSLKELAEQVDAARSEIDARISQQELEALEKVELGRYALNRLHGLALGVSIGKEVDREAVRCIYERLSAEQKASQEGREILGYIRVVEKVDVGSPIPDYEFLDLDGNARRLSEFQGQWLLLDFWQFGCAPCFYSVPELGEVCREFEGRLTVVSISLDADVAWRKATEQHGIFWNNWRDPSGNGGVLQSYGTGAIPTFVLVSPDGIIRLIHVGYSTGVLHELVQSAN